MVVFAMAHNKSADPDGFSHRVLPTLLGCNKMDLLALVNDFQQSKIISRVNYGTITLIPNKKIPQTSRKFRLICLLNVSFKIITKLLMGRLSPVVDLVVGPTQTSFPKSCYVMVGFLIHMKFWIHFI